MAGRSRGPARPGGRHGPVATMHRMTTIAEPAAVNADERRVAEMTEQLLTEHPPASTKPREFLGAQFDLGLAWIHFPEGNGGLGLSPKLQEVVATRLRKAG